MPSGPVRYRASSSRVRVSNFETVPSTEVGDPDDVAGNRLLRERDVTLGGAHDARGVLRAGLEGHGFGAPLDGFAVGAAVPAGVEDLFVGVAVAVIVFVVALLLRVDDLSFAGRPGAVTTVTEAAHAGPHPDGTFRPFVADLGLERIAGAAGQVGVSVRAAVALLDVGVGVVAVVPLAASALAIPVAIGVRALTVVVVVVVTAVVIGAGRGTASKTKGKEQGKGSEAREHRQTSGRDHSRGVGTGRYREPAGPRRGLPGLRTGGKPDGTGTWLSAWGRPMIRFHVRTTRIEADSSPRRSGTRAVGPGSGGVPVRGAGVGGRDGPPRAGPGPRPSEWPPGRHRSMAESRGRGHEHAGASGLARRGRARPDRGSRICSST